MEIRLTDRQLAQREPPRHDLETLARSVFGFAKLRPFQKEVFRALEDGLDVLTVVPTGSGKSLCYILPALATKWGLTIVVSPLIALMRDQVASLRARGIEARSLDGQQSREDQLEVWETLKRGEVRLLFISPERLSLPSFRNYLTRFDIRLIAIDEAHCVSQWGYHFRPDYRKIGLYLREFSDTPRLALTATATSEVLSDIEAKLGLREPTRVVAPPKRDNLSLEYFSFSKKQDRFDSAIRDTLSRKEPGIVYCATRKDVEAAAQSLRSHATKGQVVFYHGGMQAAERQRAAASFLSSEAQIIVATVAFGMGVHREDIRFVHHLGMPATLEQFLQGIGRAGRDGLPATAALYYHKQDYHLQRFLLDRGTPALALLKQAFHTLGKATETKSQALSHEDAVRLLASGCGGKRADAEQVFSVLDREGLLRSSFEGGRLWVHGVDETSDFAQEFFSSYDDRRYRSLSKLATMRQFAELRAGRTAFLESYFNNKS